MQKLFLWKISQEVNNEYDTYSAAVVVASDPESAKRVHPSVDSHTGEAWNYYEETKEDWYSIGDGEHTGSRGWAAPTDITAICVGEAAEELSAGTVVCSSFHAG